MKTVIQHKLLCLPLLGYLVFRHVNWEGFLLTICVFIASFNYRKHLDLIVMLSICLFLLQASLESAKMLGVCLLLDLAVNVFPKNLERTKFCIITSVIYIGVLGIFKRKFNDYENVNILQMLQIAAGSFQAIRIFERNLKFARTDLGCIYYKAQILILLSKISDCKCQAFLEAINLFIIITAVWLRPEVYDNNFELKQKTHGVLMRISFAFRMVTHQLYL